MTAFVGAAMKELVETHVTLALEMAPQSSEEKSSHIEQPLIRAAEYSDAKLENIVRR